MEAFEHCRIDEGDKHRDLLAALEKGDVAAAALAMAEDVEQGMQQVRSALDERAGRT